MAEIDPEVLAHVAKDTSILEAFNMQLEAAGDGMCELSAVVTRELVNAGGFAHGAIAFSLMDTACAYALRSLGRSGVTLNANVTYVRGGKAGDTLRGVTHLATQTRRVATFRAETWLDTDEEPILAAHGTFVFQLRDPD